MKKSSGKVHETGLHIGIVHALRLDFLPEDLIVYHAANGGLRDKIEAAKLKKMGVLPGVADLTCHWPEAVEINGNIGLMMETGYIEIKTPDGFLQTEQGIFRDRVKAMGGRYKVCRSYEEVRNQLVAWGCKCQHRVRFT